MTVLSDATSCTYEYYQNNIKPKPQPVGTMPKGEIVWRCAICGYEYVGKNLPDDFICPICKHGKDDFEKIIRQIKTKDVTIVRYVWLRTYI